VSYILRSSTVIRRHWFSEAVTGTPTAQLYVGGVASGGPLVGEGTDEEWVFTVPIGVLAFGTSVEIWCAGLVGAKIERARLVDGFIADTVADVGADTVGDWAITRTFETADGAKVSGVRMSLVGVAGKSTTTGVDGVAVLMADGDTAYTLRVAVPVGYAAVSDTQVVLSGTDSTATVTLEPLTVFPGGMPADASLILAVLRVRDQVGNPCVAAKVEIEVAGNPAISDDKLLINTPNPVFTDSQGQAVIPVYRGQRYTYRATYRRFAPAELTRTAPTAGDSFVVTLAVV
jgi:hypothetical protein